MASPIFRTFTFTAAALLGFASTASAQTHTGRFVRGAGLDAPTITESTESTMDFKPYAASYLPTHKGPLSRERDRGIERMIENGFSGGECDLVHQVIKDNAKKATTEKFDTAVESVEGRSPNATETYNRDNYNPDAETWEGLCHLWAPAGLDPAAGFIVAMDKIYADVPFGVGDLKELTTWSYPRASTRFFGKRNYSKDEPQAESDLMDPVDLLTIFDNYVGPGKPGVVLDVDPGYMVWNQPVYSVKKNVKPLYGAAARNAPEGGKAFRVELTAEYGMEGHYAHRGDSILHSKTWNMTVYTDAAGTVTGARWSRDRGDEIPDFAWVPEVKNTNANMERLKKIASEGVSVEDIETFCNLMAGLTAEGFAAGDAKAIAEVLAKICPVLDQNELSDYVRMTAERTGIDYSALDAELEGGINPANG